MLLSYFTEQPYSAFSEEQALRLHDFDHSARQAGANVLLHSNRFFDPEEGSRLYADRLAEYMLAEEVGFDGVMLNEHHAAAFCMQARCSIFSAVLAATTKRVKIIQLGNPLPLWDNPVQLAEEIGMIDMISGGRLVSGIVRGGGPEQLANNINPAFNRARFVEAHDLLIKTWTTPGPFRWEGEHYHVRVVNPWALPLQRPHPRIFVPGVASKETVEFAARHGYPYVCLSTTIDLTKQIWQLYDSIAAEAGGDTGPAYRGYLLRCHVAETEAAAIANARQFMWMNGEFAGVGHPVWSSPPGYTNQTARKKRMAPTTNTFESQLESGAILAGTPSQIIPRIENLLRETRPGMLMIWSNDGLLGHAESMKCIELMGREVLPAIREIGDRLGLQSPFEANTPISLQQALLRTRTAAA